MSSTRRPSRHIRLSSDRALIELQFRYDAAVKDAIKRIPGASWDAEQRIWAMEAHHASELLHIIDDLEEAEPFVVDDEVRALAARGGNNARMRQLRRATRTDSLTPSTLNARLSGLISDTFSERFWIIGQISNWKDKGYFELIEQYEDEGHPRAKLDAYISIPDYQHIERLLSEQRPPLSWQNRLKVRLKAQLSMRERWGSLQLRVVDIDPFYTITLMNAAREEALRALDEEGLSERNLALDVPPVPLRVALLTSADSDAAHDFVAELRESGLGFAVDLYDVRVSGPNQERMTLAALARTAARSDDYDVLVMIRGGGSRSDLSGFDQLSIGRAVCAHPLPILCGIGHERDHSLIDDIARSHKTPTRAASALVDHVRGFLSDLGLLQAQVAQQAGDRARSARDALSALARGVGSGASQKLQLADRDLRDVELDIRRGSIIRLSRENERLDRLAVGLPQGWRRRQRREVGELGHLQRRLSPNRLLSELRREGALLAAAENRLLRSSTGRLRDARQTLDALSARREAADPARVLERGFAVVTRPDGAIVRDAGSVAAGEGLVVRLGAGQMNVTRDDEDGHQ